MPETNVCKYCGQVGLGPCDCDDAKRERVRREYLERANKEIENLLKADDGVSLADEETIDLLKSVAEFVSYRCLQNVKFTLTNGITVSVKRVAAGAIKVERSESKKSSVAIVGGEV